MDTLTYSGQGAEIKMVILPDCVVLSRLSMNKRDEHII